MWHAINCILQRCHIDFFPLPPLFQSTERKAVCWQKSVGISKDQTFANWVIYALELCSKPQRWHDLPRCSPYRLRLAKQNTSSSQARDAVLSTCQSCLPSRLPSSPPNMISSEVPEKEASSLKPSRIYNSSWHLCRAVGFPLLWMQLPSCLP